MRDEPARTGPAPDGASFREQMDHKLFTERGRDLYKKRQVIVEPVFGQIKEVRTTRRFSRRGKAAADAEWKLICGTHNLLKLYRRGRAAEPAPTSGAPRSTRRLLSHPGQNPPPIVDFHRRTPVSDPRRSETRHRHPFRQQTPGSGIPGGPVGAALPSVPT